MRICYVAPDVAVPHYRGSSTHVYEVARNLSKLGHEVHVMARRVDSAQPKKEDLDGMTIHRFQRGIVLSSRRSSFVNSEAKGSYRGNTSSIVWKSYETYLKTIFPLYIALELTRLVRESSIDIIFERETAFGAGAVGSMLTGRPLSLVSLDAMANCRPYDAETMSGVFKDRQIKVRGRVSPDTVEKTLRAYARRDPDHRKAW